MLAAAAIAPGFTDSDAENTASAQGKTHSAEVKRTRRRNLTIDALKDAGSAKRDDRSSVHRVTSGVERSARGNGDRMTIQRATVSDDMDMISLDGLMVSAAELTISDDMIMISIDKLTVSAAELSVSDDMDMFSIDKPTVSDDMNMISLDGLTVSAAELSVSDDMDMFSIDELTVSAAELSISADIDKNSPDEAKISTAQGTMSVSKVHPDPITALRSVVAVAAIRFARKRRRLRH